MELAVVGCDGVYGDMGYMGWVMVWGMLQLPLAPTVKCSHTVPVVPGHMSSNATGVKRPP